MEVINNDLHYILQCMKILSKSSGNNEHLEVDQSLSIEQMFLLT